MRTGTETRGQNIALKLVVEDKLGLSSPASFTSACRASGGKPKESLVWSDLRAFTKAVSDQSWEVRSQALPCYRSPILAQNYPLSRSLGKILLRRSMVRSTKI